MENEVKNKEVDGEGEGRGAEGYLEGEIKIREDEH